MDLAELIAQIHPPNSAAANRLDEFQRSILKGLVKWDVAVNFYVKTYQLCVTARKDVRKKKRSTDGMHPTSRTSFVQYEFYKKCSRQKAHQWQQDVSKLLTLAYLCLEAHKMAEEPGGEEQEAEAPQMDPEVGNEDEDVEMTALAAAVHGTE